MQQDSTKTYSYDHGRYGLMVAGATSFVAKTIVRLSYAIISCSTLQQWWMVIITAGTLIGVAWQFKKLFVNLLGAYYILKKGLS